MVSEQLARLCLFPLMAEVSSDGHLVIGGCDAVDLAVEFGTPLYVFDRASLLGQCVALKTEFGQRYNGTTIVYAAKAFINKTLLRLFRDEGLGLDVVSGGELGIARAAGFPLERVYFHGNNKSAEELRMALDWGVGRIVVDNLYELRMLNGIADQMERTPDILLRLTPGVDPHTHRHITTGNVDSKFGFPLALGEEAVMAAMSLPNLNLIGIHFHLGSLIFETDPYKQAIELILNFAADMRKRHGFELGELDIGGGFAVQYTLDSPEPPLATYAGVIATAVLSQCRKLGLELHRLIIEPGRSIVARAGVALYRVGVMKGIPGIRSYVAVDGGMADNVRPALYEARYEAVIAGRMKEKVAGKFTIAGKFCESGDVLAWDVGLPAPVAGDVLAVPGCGAYCLSQASNYNASFKVAVAMVGEGKATLIRRREGLEDLIRCDID